MDIFFTSDTHYNHSNILKYCKRSFSSIEEHDQVLLDNYNNTIKRNDRIFFLGDLSFDPERYINKLNGQITFILGNHDKKPIHFYKSYKSIVKVSDLLTVKIEDIYIVLCHYALAIWDKSHFNSFHCYGHSHGTFQGKGKCLDVGIDNACNLFGEYRPFHWDEIKKIIDSKPDNFNLVRREG